MGLKPSLGFLDFLKIFLFLRRKTGSKVDDTELSQKYRTEIPSLGQPCKLEAQSTAQSSDFHRRTRVFSGLWIQI